MEDTEVIEGLQDPIILLSLNNPFVIRSCQDENQIFGWGADLDSVFKESVLK